MTNLIARIEAADGPSAALFWKAWNVVYGSSPNIEWWDRYGSIEVAIPGDKHDLYVRFRKMLDAEAWTSAAEMLMPDGWAWSLIYERERELSAKPPYFADMRDGYRSSYSKAPHAWASHPSLALLAAALKARGE